MVAERRWRGNSRCHYRPCCGPSVEPGEALEILRPAPAVDHDPEERTDPLLASLPGLLKPTRVSSETEPNSEISGLMYSLRIVTISTPLVGLTLSVRTLQHRRAEHQLLLRDRQLPMLAGGQRLTCAPGRATLGPICVRRGEEPTSLGDGPGRSAWYAGLRAVGYLSFSRCRWSTGWCWRFSSS